MDVFNATDEEILSSLEEASWFRGPFKGSRACPLQHRYLIPAQSGHESASCNYTYAFWRVGPFVLMSEHDRLGDKHFSWAGEHFLVGR